LIDKSINETAIKLIARLDDSLLYAFHDWNYFYRGIDYWDKNYRDSSFFRCGYSNKDNTSYLYVQNPYNFNVEFPCSFEIDTSKYYQYTFKLSKDTIVGIIGVNNEGKDIPLLINGSLNNLFNHRNPFSIIGRLSLMVDSFGIRNISYWKGGDCIEFTLSDQHVLTYIADSLMFVQSAGDYSIQELAKGKMIKKGWNLRKLERPVEP